MANSNKSSLRVIILVAIMAITASVIVSGSYEISHEKILKNEQNQQLATLDELLQNSSYDEIIENFNSTDSINIIENSEPRPLYIAIRNNAATAVIYSAGSSQGYNGPIDMLIGISMDGNVMGVRIINHRETPGLGDLIEIEKSDWITHFNQKSLLDPPLSEWKVVKDGGKCEGFSSATISARAAIHTVREALINIEKNKEKIISDSLVSSIKINYE